MGKILAANGQIKLAIIFYKQLSNVTELIRQDLQTLLQYQQEYYVKAITETYRQLRHKAQANTALQPEERLVRV